MSEKKISNGLVEMSSLSYFFVALSEVSRGNEENEQSFFLSFVEYIRQGNSIKNAIDFAQKDQENEEG